MNRTATELVPLQEALRKVDVATEFVPRLLARLTPFISLRPGDPVLDVGAAQGVNTTAFLKHGFAARGVEPSAEALATRGELMAATGVQTDIVQGVGEHLPFGDAEFQYVHVYSVMEHVDDPWQVMRECYRVLRPGGGMFFSTTAAISPLQNEIDGFPLFPWYPDALRRRIMTWAMNEKPWLVGHTDRPAFLWFKHREVQHRLREIGFSRLVDMWEMRAAAHESTGLRRVAVEAAARNRLARLAGNVAFSGMEYLAVK